MKILFWILFCVAISIAQDKIESTKILEESSKAFPFEMAKSPLESINLFQYSGVILILVGLLVLLWYVRKRVYYKDSNNNFLDFFKKNPKDFPITILSNTPLSLNTKLVVFELYKMRYIVILNQNGATLVDKYPLEDFGELLKQEKH
ncbi:hypothetical protein [Helicobacter canadensis]|uniref:Uncharacterized protein n=1 Tax=Helicobacter canadensis MIT 98-5491 TaxID=537970 RepID=C5ZVH3_9HELI|nr:hypothetical protein [Helicobacter canadensis]EES89097.1 hypothetical protein HCAN_0379 [Helicobacter canadensis MIT 98-5491]EFR47874.1 hypothetical protein HCMG_00047 [Helicobacter canadensis MIT 98-5491]STO99128.1 Uncharacterised protein [Helicobacter canadensis]